MLKLTHIPATHIDKAWHEGAHQLGEACKYSGGEITADQLKMILSRGERSLIRMDDQTGVVGWGVVRIDQLPNFRVLHITDLYAPRVHFERFYDELKLMAESLGCSRIRCAAQPAQAKIYETKCGFKPVYQIMEVEI
jgi:hypothetical protein